MQRKKRPSALVQLDRRQAGVVHGPVHLPHGGKVVLGITYADDSDGGDPHIAMASEVQLLPLRPLPHLRIPRRNINPHSYAPAMAPVNRASLSIFIVVVVLVVMGVGCDAGTTFVATGVVMTKTSVK